MKIGLQSYTLRNYLGSESEIKTTFAKLNKIGIEYLETAGFGAKPEIVKSIADDNGLKCVANHVGMDDAVNEPNRVIDEALLYGQEILGLPGYSVVNNNLKDSIEYFENKIPNLVEQAASAGLQVIYHNHSHEFDFYNGKWVWEYLKNSCPNLKFEVDVYWSAVAGIDGARLVKDNPDRVLTLHLKDMATENGQPKMASVGYGNLDWPRIFKQADAAGVAYGFIELDETYGKDEFTAIKESFDFLTKALS